MASPSCDRKLDYTTHITVLDRSSAVDKGSKGPRCAITENDQDRQFTSHLGLGLTHKNYKQHLSQSHIQMHIGGKKAYLAGH